MGVQSNRGVTHLFCFLMKPSTTASRFIPRFPRRELNMCGMEVGSVPEHST